MIMMDYIDKGILFVFCLTLHIFDPNSTLNVVLAIIAVIATASMGYFDQPKQQAVIFVCFAAVCAFVPELTLFMPLICYDLLFKKYQLICLIGIIPFVIYLQTAAPIIIAGICMLLVFSVLLKHRAVALIELKSSYYDAKDSAKEMSIRLKKQNSDLQEKQDVEINLATLNERNRIAREIHDNVGHLLSSSILQIAALLAINKDAKVKENLLIVNDTLSQAMNSIRSSVHDLHDESVDIYAQVNELVEKFTFCELNFDYDIQHDPDRKLKYAFISIVKEALNNIVKHSNASKASITFREHPAFYQLIISDNGSAQKFDMDDGIGLKNITERVESFQGNINITAKNGFHIFISVPKKGAQL
jgi:signal transduction histidine kinase